MYFNIWISSQRRKVRALSCNQAQLILAGLPEVSGFASRELTVSSYFRGSKATIQKKVPILSKFRFQLYVNADSQL